MCSACIRNLDLWVHLFTFLEEEGGPLGGFEGGGSFCHENVLDFQ